MLWLPYSMVGYWLPFPFHAWGKPLSEIVWLFCFQVVAFLVIYGALAVVIHRRAKAGERNGISHFDSEAREVTE